MNNQVLLVTWESFSGGRTNNVQILPERTARLVANNYRTSRRRRADIIPLTPDNIKRFLS